MVLSVNTGSSVQKWMPKALLSDRLTGLNGKEVRIPQMWIVRAQSIGDYSEQIIDRVLSDVEYMRRLDGARRETVVGSYVESLE